ncbi:MAG: ferrous iron transport protein B [Treponema sp.]|jgi:ferrous iron transport protein B|nr:ferrous iron transport protein B [Treponema sp.]
MGCEYCKEARCGKAKDVQANTNACTVALLGQPNSGKSTLFNALTGGHQRVGNWPGKTVEKKQGSFQYGGNFYTVIDLPGSYSLSAGSDEEIVTRNYIATGEADIVCILADASQLERSLYMLADFAGINTPAVLLLNMMDVAKEKGKEIDAKLLEERLGIPVVPFVASSRKDYGAFYAAVRNAEKYKRTLVTDGLDRLYEDVEGGVLNSASAFIPREGAGLYSPLWLAAKITEGDGPAIALVRETLSGERRTAFDKKAPEIKNGNLVTADCKFRWIGALLDGAVHTVRENGAVLSRFDRLALGGRWGKWIAFGIMLLGFVGSTIPFFAVSTAAGLIPSLLGPPLAAFLRGLGVTPFLTAFAAEGLLNALYMTLAMTSYVFGVTVVFGFIEEVGYMARVSFVFDGVMSRLGLQGKAIMPFFVSLGCTMGGAAAARVIDSYGQRLLAMTLLWAVPCGAIFSTIPMLAGMFFGWGALFVMFGIVLVMILHMVITAKIFRPRLVPGGERGGMIMELPPYHKPKWGELFRYALLRVKTVFVRAFRVVFVVTLLFFCLSWTPEGNTANSLIYKIGTFIEPVTRVFGLGWQTFMAFVAAVVAKEAVLGVLNALYTGSISLFASAVVNEGTVAANLGDVLAASISKPEALAFIFAVTFTVPCVMAVASTYSENHSLKWTLKIAVYYVVTALLLSFVIYHVSSFFFRLF